MASRFLRAKKLPIQDSKLNPIPSPSADEATVFPFSPRTPGWLMGLLLVAATVLAYLPVWHAGFIWDDDNYACSWDSLRQIWFVPGVTVQYYPLTFTVFWAEYHLWGLHPLGYHLVNVALQGCNALLLWRVLRYLRVPGPWLGAALFALHPVGVETVAWVTEYKNTISGLFYLCSLLAALKFWLPEAANSPATQNDQPAMPRYGSGKFFWLTFALYLGALTSKTTTLPLPAVVLLLVWWKRGKINWRDIGLVGLFLAAGAAMGLITMRVEAHLGATGEAWHFSWLTRCLLAGRDAWFYLGKLLWPHPLIFIYPRHPIDPSQLSAYLPVLALLGVLAMLWWQRQSWGRPVLVAFLYFLALVFLVLGFFNVYFFRYSFVCDHFQYLASMGPLALAAAGIATVFGRVRGPLRPVGTVACAGLLGVLGAMTWNQCRAYADTETLWRTTIDRNPRCWIAHNNLGQLLAARGQWDEAIILYREALAIDPGSVESHNDLGNALMQKGDIAGAIVEFHAAQTIQPDNATVAYNLGNALLADKQVDQAIAQFQNALTRQPDYAEAHDNLGRALLLKGQVYEAIVEFQFALARQPGMVAARDNLELIAWAMATAPDARMRNGPEAVTLAEQVDELSGGTNPEAAATLAAAYAEAGRFPEAIAAAQRAVQLAKNQNNDAMIAAIQAQLKCYQAGLPFRQ